MRKERERDMKKLIAILLAIVLLSMITGCSQSHGDSTIPTGTQKPNETADASQPESAETPETNKPADVETTQPVPLDTISSLRAQMQEKLIAVADFGFPELSERYGIMDYLQDKYPWWLEEYEFVRDMPEEQIILTCDYGTPANLVCIVPADAGVTIRVNVGCTMDESPYEKWSIVYQSESGEPILLLANDADGMKVTVDITDGNAQETTWYPYKGATEPFPGDARSDGLVFDFAPVYDGNAYEDASAQGWFAPETEAFQTYHYWRSDYRYLLELNYEPDGMYDGRLWLYDYCGMSELVGEEFSANYNGYWYYRNGVLHLDLDDYVFNKIPVELSVLTNTEDASNIVIFCAEDSTGLPQFRENMKYDVLKTRASDAMSFYDYALYEGWRLPELHELNNTGWQSDLGYYLELKDDAVPGDNNGNAALYDVSENGAFTLTYTGAWSYADGMLHLLLVPQNNGQFIDDNFPVLMLDGQLMICLNEYGNGLPNFTVETMADVLMPS